MLEARSMCGGSWLLAGLVAGGAACSAADTAEPEVVDTSELAAEGSGGGADAGTDDCSEGAVFPEGDPAEFETCAETKACGVKSYDDQIEGLLTQRCHWDTSLTEVTELLENTTKLRQEAQEDFAEVKKSFDSGWKLACLESGTRIVLDGLKSLVMCKGLVTGWKGYWTAAKKVAVCTGTKTGRHFKNLVKTKKDAAETLAKEVVITGLKGTLVWGLDSDTAEKPSKPITIRVLDSVVGTSYHEIQAATCAPQDDVDVMKGLTNVTGNLLAREIELTKQKLWLEKAIADIDGEIALEEAERQFYLDEPCD